MAIRPDYDIGELTLTSGSSDFTTSGSSLQTAAVQAGDAIIAPSGHVLIIASVTGQNSGTLFLPCPPAAAGTGLPLRIRFQPDGSRYQGAVRNLIDLLSSGNIEAFAALVGADGMVPIFTGPGTLDLADPATFGIQDPNGSLGKLAALTLAARQILQTDETGDLKQVALEANKFLRTDANGDLALSDLGAAAIALLNLSGAPSANKLPYFDGANSAALTDFTALARTVLASATGAAIWSSIGGTSSLGNNGWIKFPDGLIIQWGRNGLDSVGAFNPQVLGGVTYYTHFYYITLPIPFPNAFYSVTGSNLGWTPQNQGSMAGKTLNLGREGSDLNRFALSFSAPQTGDAPLVGWIAVGR